jgi:hypothetical protein
MDPNPEHFWIPCDAYPTCLRGHGQFISISIYFLLQRGSEKRKPRVRAQYEHISMAVSGQPVLGKPALQTEQFYTLQ